MQADCYSGRVRRLALLISVFHVASLFAAGQDPSARRAPDIQFKNAAPGVAYVGSKTCAECHSDVYASFRKTDMGRSMSQPDEFTQLKTLHEPVRIKHPRADRYYEIYRRGAEIYESETELDAAGKEIYRDEHKLEYVIGSGANGLTFIVRRGNYLFEAPLSYYSKSRSWAPSPGYEQHDYSFSRPIQADCISCHSGRPKPIEANDGLFEEPPFEELAIGCESCHGPGALHVAERRNAAPLSGPVDQSIVNPAHLPSWLANNICMYCHQGLDAAVLMPGKHYADFRPGTPLADTLAIFAVPFRRDAPPQEPLLQHFVLMNLSQCYLKSDGKLSCITCHDPHNQPAPAMAPAYFRAKCLTCHTERSCKLSLRVRKAKTPPDDCTGCHMPRQNLQDISHSSLTNHRIVARPGEPLPESAFHLASPALPDLVYLDAIPDSWDHLPVKAASDDKVAVEESLPPLALFRAYGELMTSHPEYRPRFDAMMDLLSDSQDSQVLGALARKWMTDESPQAESKAEEYFERAIRSGSTSPEDFELLATLQVKSGRMQQAIATVTRGLQVSPYSVQLYRDLARLYLAVQDPERAVATMKKNLEIFPEDSFTRSLLQETLAGKE